MLLSELGINKQHDFYKVALTCGVSVILLAVAVFFLATATYAFPGHKTSDGKVRLMTAGDPVVVMDTNKGTIKIEIFQTDAPTTAGNFLDLVKRGFYNGLTFHRYEPGFCLQGGDPRGTGTGGFVDPQTNKERTIPLEVTPKLKHDSAGVVAMARSDNPDSASSQFYFTLGAASFLDGKYAVFGKVIDGMDVMSSLRKGDKMTKVSILQPATK